MHVCPACRGDAKPEGCLCGISGANGCPIPGHPIPHLMRPAPKSLDRAIFADFMKEPDMRSKELQ